MSNDPSDKDYASPACMASEIAPDYFGPVAADPVQSRDAERWRKAERSRLIETREALSASARKAADDAIASHLDTVLAERFGGAEGMVITGYWPIRSEIDLRGWMQRQAKRGVRIALPVVTARNAPLIFRPWTPEAKMRKGLWKIPEPDTAETCLPQIMLAPLVGWDSSRFRMGYGGGFYDRTLSSLRPRPYAIGIGLQSGQLRTIYPQPHDEALDLIVTEAGPA
ncbi:5-formyltetrahydrofolate cyclo-ligase [Paracoccus aerodenitrificans]|uniref:5-formyltetrahydrofolate cyclo-ligase n=1 Tax=Paracoccus aerodenitrificans TaxID=3017781 RepID=UPI0022F09B7D|nr:5-formyltetrahydrofolate cyclo-ligase [Paracoccus aerodenitrificans]WBU63338.1 5-formyltetrahydrofolate cyclo-ligase [Paracoccus aerodenitrificans]